VGSIDKVATGWRARWRTPDGQSRSKSFKRKADAQRHLANVEHSKLTGMYVDPSAGRVGFRSYAEHWRAIQVHRPATARQVEGCLRNHVYPRIGDRPIGAVRPSEIQTLIKTLEDTLAPGSVNLVYTWTSAIFAAAVADQMILKSPCRDIKRTRSNKENIVPLTVDTVQSLIEAAPDRYRTLIAFGAGTGVRIGEALGLTTDRVDWMRRTVLIDRQLLKISAGQPIFGPVKHVNNRPRTIPLPEVTLAALVEHVRVFRLGPEGLVFTNHQGRPIWQATFGDVWQKAARPLGIPPGEGFHQLRHFYASLLIRHGENVKVVAERLGDTPQMVLNGYPHLWPGDDDRTRQAVDEVLGGSASPSEQHRHQRP
jgi:integrase